ncbi:MAG: hypothetical protein IT579_11360 [Verrucomicrobia subdivision 3 bacterium]|nr:hypothetical protein [Limisphaerales bacterium]
MKTRSIGLRILLFLGLAGSFAPAAPLGTAFTYQGRLNVAGIPAAGNYDLRFAICTAAAGGSAVAGPITNSPVDVNNGLFTVTLDFGAEVFAGDARWLEIAVRVHGGGAFTELAPRQALTVAPYASYAGNSATAGGFSGSLGGDVSGSQGATVVTSVAGYAASAVVAGTMAANAASSANVPGTIVKRDGGGNFSANAISGNFSGNGAGLTSVTAVAVVPEAVTSAGIATGQVVKSLNGLTDAVTLTAGSNVSLVTMGNAMTISSSPGVPAPVPPGTIVLSQTLDNPALTAAGFASVADPSWQLATNAAAWTARARFPAVAFNGQLWVLGGAMSSNTSTNDIWSSFDGANWFPATNSAAWTARQGHVALIYGDKTWMMGGSVGTNQTNDVWCSRDGTNYVQATNAAAWSPPDSRVRRGIQWADVAAGRHQCWLRHADQRCLVFHRWHQLDLGDQLRCVGGPGGPQNAGLQQPDVGARRRHRDRRSYQRRVVLCRRYELDRGHQFRTMGAARVP